MYRKISGFLTEKYIISGTIPGEKREVYEYGFEVLISTIVYTIIFLLIAICFGEFLSSVLFWGSFLVIRKLAGGYHAKTYLQCHILFCTNHLVFLFLIKVIPIACNSLCDAVLLAFSSIILFVFAPVDHPNKPFVAGEQRKHRRLSIIYAILILISILPTLVFGPKFEMLFFAFSFGTLSAAISTMSAKIKRKGEHCR